MFERVADPVNHPLVFHCTAGSDRTGALAAVLLSVLGVDDETILDDYELTDGTAPRTASPEPLAAAGVELTRCGRFLGATPGPGPLHLTMLEEPARCPVTGTAMDPATLTASGESGLRDGAATPWPRPATALRVRARTARWPRPRRRRRSRGRGRWPDPIGLGSPAPPVRSTARPGSSSSAPSPAPVQPGSGAKHTRVTVVPSLMRVTQPGCR